MNDKEVSQPAKRKKKKEKSVPLTPWQKKVIAHLSRLEGSYILPYHPKDPKKRRCYYLVDASGVTIIPLISRVVIQNLFKKGRIEKPIGFIDNRYTLSENNSEYKEGTWGGHSLTIDWRIELQAHHSQSHLAETLKIIHQQLNG